MGPLLKNYPNLDFLGKKMAKELAQAIAKGEIDPMSHRPYSLIEQDQYARQFFYRKNNGAKNKPIQIIDNPVQFNKIKNSKATEVNIKGTIHNFFQISSKTVVE